MIETSATRWHDANQRYLLAALAEVRAVLERHAASDSSAVPPGARGPQLSRSAPDGVAGQPTPPAIEQVCSTFGLTPFERDVLLLCAGVELDAAFGPLCAAAQGDPTRTHPTFSLALAALAEPHWSALTPDAPLRRWRLINVGAGSTLALSPLRIDERVLHFLAGVSQLDAQLAGLVTPARSAGDLVESHRAVAERLVAVWSRDAGSGQPSIVQLCGADANARRAIAIAACAALGLNLCVLSADAVPLTPTETESLARLWEREAALSASALLIDCDSVDGTDVSRVTAVARLIARLGSPLIVSGRERLPAHQTPAITFDVHRPGAEEQRGIWGRVLGTASSDLNGHVDALVSQFSLNAAAIQSAAAEALATPTAEPAADLNDRLWNACRAQARPRLDDLAQRIELAARWDDLVVPEMQRQTLRDIATHVRQRARVYETWGFAGRGARGLGISALFAGASGTGKTMAAEVLANELRLDLYRIDLSQVVSKYIGETEKNLRRVFEAAEEGGAILLFDEADALFSKRSEIKDSHDRYANIEVSYLLQRMETYRGLAILTSNMKSALDTAFLRRIRFVVQFLYPDVNQRAEIWRRVFPPSAPTDGLDVSKLARLDVAGGNIRNIALNAAFMAADEGQPVRMRHLLRAARGEYAKMEKTLTDSEIGGWV